MHKYTVRYGAMMNSAGGVNMSTHKVLTSLKEGSNTAYVFPFCQHDSQRKKRKEGTQWYCVPGAEMYSGV